MDDVLEDEMVPRTREVVRVADARSVPLVSAAYIVALERLGAAMDAHGTARLYDGP